MPLWSPPRSPAKEGRNMFKRKKPSLAVLRREITECNAKGKGPATALEKAKLVQEFVATSGMSWSEFLATAVPSPAQRANQRRQTNQKAR
jgi:hypothetical protein